MTTVQITLPDALALEAASAGLLAPEKIERILRERLRQAETRYRLLFQISSEGVVRQKLFKLSFVK